MALVRTPSLVELQAFLAVAKAGTFSSAAEALCVTQAAVSRSVKRLELTLGRDVFHRHTEGVQLTPAGAELMQLIAGPVAAIQAATVRVQQRPSRHKLRLSVVPSLGHLWLMPRLPAFWAGNPDIELELRQPHHDESFTRDDVDTWIEVKRTRSSSWPRQITARYLVGRDVVTVCTPQVAVNIRRPEDVLKHPLLYHSGYPENWAVWARAARIRFSVQSLTTGFDSVMNLIQGAAAGLGVALVQRCLVEGQLRSGILVMPIPISASTGRGYYLCQRRSLGPHMAAERFTQWVLRQAQLPR